MEATLQQYHDAVSQSERGISAHELRLAELHRTGDYWESIAMDSALRNMDAGMLKLSAERVSAAPLHTAPRPDVK
jgi:hypothetical protein